MTDTDQFTTIEYGKQEADVVRPADIAVADHVAPSESDVVVTSQGDASASADSETATDEASAGAEKAPVGITDAGATHDFSPHGLFGRGGLSTNPDPVEVLAERVARLERRFRHS